MPKSVKGVMGEYKRGVLHSGSSTGRVVTNPRQAVAIAMAEQRQQAGAPPVVTNPQQAIPAYQRSLQQQAAPAAPPRGQPSTQFPHRNLGAFLHSSRKK